MAAEKSARITVALTGEDYTLLKAETVETGLSFSSILKSYSLQYIRLRDETAQAAAGQLVPGSTLHTMITGMEARLSQTVGKFDGNLFQIERTLNVVLAMLDTYVKLYLAHTPEIPQSIKDGQAALALERYKRFMHQLQSHGFKRAHDRLLEVMDAAAREETPSTPDSEGSANE